MPAVLERLDGIAAHLTAVYFEVCCFQMHGLPYRLLATCRLLCYLHTDLLNELLCQCCANTVNWLQLEGTDGAVSHLGTEYYTTLRSEADQDLSAATVASEEAHGEISRYLHWQIHRTWLQLHQFNV